jgi:adenylosuccinate synthase
MDALCITKLDVLDELEEIRVWTRYDLNGSEVVDFPASEESLENCKPVYQTFSGWKTNTHAVNKLEGLPGKARTYLEFIENFLQIPIALLSTSPERDDTIFYPAFDTLCDRS